MFLLCCVWRASISKLEDYPIKLNKRKESNLRKILLNGGSNRLLHTYSMIHSRYGDKDYSLATAPFSERGNKINLIGFIYFSLMF